MYKPPTYRDCTCHRRPHAPDCDYVRDVEQREHEQELRADEARFERRESARKEPVT